MSLTDEEKILIHQKTDQDMANLKENLNWIKTPDPTKIQKSSQNSLDFLNKKLSPSAIIAFIILFIVLGYLFTIILQPFLE